MNTKNEMNWLYQLRELNYSCKDILKRYKELIEKKPHYLKIDGDMKDFNLMFGAEAEKRVQEHNENCKRELQDWQRALNDLRKEIHEILYNVEGVFNNRFKDFDTLEFEPILERVCDIDSFDLLLPFSSIFFSYLVVGDWDFIEMILIFMNDMMLLEEDKEEEDDLI